MLKIIWISEPGLQRKGIIWKGFVLNIHRYQKQTFGLESKREWTKEERRDMREPLTKEGILIEHMWTRELGLKREDIIYEGVWLNRKI